MPNDKMAELTSTFLKLVRAGNILAIEHLITDPINADVSPALWGNGLQDAIHYKQINVLKALLRLRVPIDDALLHAIQSQNVPAVMEIVRFNSDPLNQYEADDGLRVDIVNSFSVTRQFPAYTSPLILASVLNNLEIAQILVDHGAIMPTEQVTLARVKNDPLERALARLQWYQSVTSAVYILLTADDPIETALMWGEMLKSKQRLIPASFSQSYDVIHRNLELLLTKLLDSATSKDEIWEALNEQKRPDGSRRSVAKRGIPSDPMGRLKRVVQLEYRVFVSHSFCQEYCHEWWFGKGPIAWGSYHGVLRGILVIALALLSPVICLLDIMLPKDVPCVRWFDRLMATPFVQHVLQTCSHVGFVLVLLFMTIGISITLVDCPTTMAFRYNVDGLNCILYVYSLFPLGSRFMAVCVWVMGLTWQHMLMVYTQGLRAYLRIYWHLLDFMSIALHWAYIVVNLSGTWNGTYDLYYSNGTVIETIGHNLYVAEIFHFHHDKYEVSRRTWDTFDPRLVGEICFALANIMSFLRLLHATVEYQFVGPLQISFGDILMDVCRFACLFIFVIVAFALGFTQLYSTYATENDAECLTIGSGDACERTSFETLLKSIRALFWAVFGQTGTETLSLPPNLWLTANVGQALFGIYMVLVTTIMLNALIAMLSNTYSRVEANARMEWHFARTRMMLEYDQWEWLPPPFNLLPRVGWWCQRGYGIFRKGYALFKKDRSFDVALEEIRDRARPQRQRRPADGTIVTKKCGGKILAERQLQHMLSCAETCQKLVYH